MSLCRYTLLLLMSLCITSARADRYDRYNYRPAASVELAETNLPIVFIDTRCDGDTTKIIHRDWRVAARMKIVNNDGGTNYGDTLAHPRQEADYDGWVAIRYRGNSSFTGQPKKPFSIHTMKTDDVEGPKLKTEILGMPRDHSWVLLAPYTDRSLIRDALMFQLARPYFDYTPRCRHCELVVDGIYYGVYLLAENIRKGKNRLNLDDPGTDGDELTGGYQVQVDRNDEDHYYTSKYFAVDSLGRTYSAYRRIYFQYKHPEYDEMTPPQLEYLHSRIDQMEDALASDDFANPDTGYRQYLDQLSFIDYQLSQEFCGNIDAYRLSTNLYKHRDSQDPRFKTAIWDFDLAFGNTTNCNATLTDFWRYQNSHFTSFNAYNKVPFWWMRLMEDPLYVDSLRQRWAQYRQQSYSIAHIVATIDSLTAMLSARGALDRNFAAWPVWGKNIAPNYKTVNTYDKEIAQLKRWIGQRVAWMDQQLGYDDPDISSLQQPATRTDGRTPGYYSLHGLRLVSPPRKGIYIEVTSAQRAVLRVGR